MKIYCPSCGNVNEYTLKKPEFCGHCRSSLKFNSEIISVPPRSKRKIEYVEEEDPSEYLPDIDGFKIHISQTGGRDSACSYRKIDANIAGTENGSIPKRKITVANERPDKKEFIKEFWKDAKSSRRNPGGLGDDDGDAI